MVSEDLKNFRLYEDILDIKIVLEIAEAPGHNSAFFFNGKNYIAYQRRIKGDINPHCSLICIDVLDIKNGRFQSVTMTN